jgi:RimJ/RimL family protein N-acetyltransferase
MIHIRALTIQDIPAYRIARLNCLRSNPNRFGTTYEEEAAKAELFFETCLKDDDCIHFMLGAFDGDALIGLCGFIRETRKRTSHRGEIVQMYVADAYQGKGIGKKLLEQAIEKAFDLPGVEQLVLSAVAENEKAVGLYRALGFEEYGVFRDYFRLEDGYLDQRFMVLYKASWQNLQQL